MDTYAAERTMLSERDSTRCTWLHLRRRQLSQEEVIKSGLPQLLAGGAFVVKSGALLERIHKLHDIAGVLSPLHQQMQMVRHKAKRVDQKNFALAHPINSSRTLRPAASRGSRRSVG